MSAQSFAPCPSCKSSNVHIAEWYSESGETEYYGQCDTCGYEDPDRFDERHVAIDHWNRRVAKGYIDGVDPTDIDYDKLEEDDHEGQKKEHTISEISWGTVAAAISDGGFRLEDYGIYYDGEYEDLEEVEDAINDELGYDFDSEFEEDFEAGLSDNFDDDFEYDE